MISTKVGDVSEISQNVGNCHLVDYNKHEIAEIILQLINTNKRIKSRNEISYLDSNLIAAKIINEYKRITE